MSDLPVFSNFDTGTSESSELDVSGQAQDTSSNATAGEANNVNDRSGPRRPIAVERLCHSSVSASAHAFDEAFKSNLGHEYVFDSANSPSLTGIAKVLCNIYHRLELHYSIFRDGIVLTTKDAPGSAVIQAFRPGEASVVPNKFLPRLLESFQRMFEQFTLTPEQKSRHEERRKKTMKLVMEVLGPEIFTDWWIINLLWTKPAAQGRGYGGALTNAVTALAESTNKHCAVISNSKNHRFYESHGFVKVGEYLLGDDNPTWYDPPIVCSLMVRKAAPVEAGN